MINQVGISQVGVWVGIFGQGTDPIDPKTDWLAQIGTYSLCGDGGALHDDEAFAEFVHAGDKNKGEYADQGPKPLFKVQPGDLIDATVTYYGIQHGTLDRENKLRFQAIIKRAHPGANFDVENDVDMWTDPGVAEADAAWQGGCIIEPYPHVNVGLSGNFPAGGLAKFTPPIQFSPCLVDNIPLSYFETSGYDNLFRWDLVLTDGTALAATGSPDPNGNFSITWQNWDPSK